MEIIYLVLGIIIGATATWFVCSSKQKSVQFINNEKSALLTSENDRMKKEITEKDTVILEVNKKLASRESDYQHLSEKLNEQKAEMEKLQERFTFEFKNLANEILEEKSKKFTELNKTNLDQILKPLNDKIKDFEKKVEETYDKEAQQRFSLKEEVKRLAELTR